MVSKKTTKKAKTTTKRARQRTVSVKKALPDDHFVLRNGEKLDHYLSLAHVVDQLDTEVFNHHVNEYKNDFATWVENVFEEVELAKQLRSCSRANDMKLVIYKYVIDKHIRVK